MPTLLLLFAVLLFGTAAYAVAYLLTVYMGVGFSEKLVCEAVRRGRSMLATLRAFSRCRPEIGVEPLPKPVNGSGFLPSKPRNAWKKGKNAPTRKVPPAKRMWMNLLGIFLLRINDQLHRP